ncbi:hypothetical protein [Streptomyces sp. NBC_00272]|uniref:hypothetical protein n=1 Tax=Streptomyces sp. NBC_00272 TaxID=2975698 RepID=UPI002E2AC82E|nr:hypothetical protein [Streptomyces sp. NBC_00272]
MWRADELELIASPSVAKDPLADQQTPRIATPDTVTITQEQVTQTLGEVFPGIADTRIERWAPAHAESCHAAVTVSGVLPRRAAPRLKSLGYLLVEARRR